MSYAVWIQLKGEAPATNGVRLQTRDEAERAGAELLSRGFEVRESADPVNYEFPAGEARPRRLTEQV